MIGTIRNRSLKSTLSGLQLGPCQTHDKLSIWPLLRDSGPDAGPGPCDLLSDSLLDGSVVVDEVSDSGSVPHVRVTNRSPRNVLVLLGDILQGAKQNRLANTSYLVPARGEVVIDVSCVEKGRWGKRGDHGFARAASVGSNELRKRVMSAVSKSVECGRGFAADQAEVWATVDQRLECAAAASPTSDYVAYEDTRSRDAEDLERAFDPLPGQVGFIAAVGSRVQGLDLLGHPELFERSFKRLLRAYSVDALDAVSALTFQEGGREAPEAFLASLRKARVRRADALGLGNDLRIEGDGVLGCALEHGSVLHLTAYPEGGR